MLALSVLLSISGCSTVENDNYYTDGDGFSFVVSIENTRTDIVNNNGAWQTVMSGDDRLYVTSDKGSFVFTNTPSDPNRFASEDENAKILRDASNIVITTLYENGCVMDSDAGKGGIALRGEVGHVGASLPAEVEVVTEGLVDNLHAGVLGDGVQDE